MSVFQIAVATLLIGTGLAAVDQVDNEPTLLERIRGTVKATRRLAYENFTQNLFSVPGYTSREAKDPADRPFEPSPECGDQFLNLTEGSFGNINSPNYPDTYSPELQCEWTIESIPGTVVEATFFDVVTQPWLFGFSDYLMVSVNGKWDTYRRFAGDTNHKMPFSFVSKGSRLGIRLVTSKWLNFRGFKMSYVVRGLKPSDNSPPENEYGGAFNNDLVAVCSSKPVKSERLNHKHQQSAPELPYRITARDGISRIVNGIETTPHQYPFMVAILADESFFCGGSLIDQNHVLTSASCIDHSQRIDLFFGVYNMSNRAENWYARQVRTIQFPDIANSVFIHPKYQSKSGANDIAILRVNSVKVTKYVQPIFLPSVYSASTSFSGWNLRTLGWGSTDSNEENLRITPVLREAAATVITSSECRESFGGSVTGNNICTKNPVMKPTTTTPASPTTTIPGTESPVTDTPTTVSTATAEAPADNTNDAETVESSDANGNPTEKFEYESPCHGDSGGPLFAEFAENYKSGGDESSGTDLNKAGSSSHECVNAKANGNGSTVKQPFQSDTACQRPKDYDEQWYVLVGVLSFGSTVCGTEVPVVYTRVTAYLQWIAYITGRHG